MFYANTTNLNLNPATNKIKITDVLSLLINLLTALASEKDHKTMIIKTTIPSSQFSHLFNDY